MLPRLTKLVDRKLIRADKGRREQPSIISYARPSGSLADPQNVELAKVLSHFGPLDTASGKLPDGAHLFQTLITIPDYYLLKAQTVLTRVFGEPIGHVIKDAYVIEPGVGDGVQTHEFFKAVGAPPFYAGIDVANAHLISARKTLSKIIPKDNLKMIEADFLNPRLKQHAALKSIAEYSKTHGLRRVGIIPGSTLENFSFPEATVFLSILRGLLDEMVVVLDSTHDTALLKGAYGNQVCAQFHIAGLAFSHQLKEFVIKIPGMEKRFEYRMRFNRETQGVEIGLVSLVKQMAEHTSLKISAKWDMPKRPLLQLSFDEGEYIHCIDSFKWSTATINELFALTAWDVKSRWSFSEARRDPSVQDILPFKDDGKNSHINVNAYHCI